MLPEKERQLNLSHISDEDKINLNVTKNINSNDEDHHQPKKAKLSFKEKKKLRGQNKSRGPTYQRERAKELCMKVIDQTENQKCLKETCPFIHNVEEYLKIKPRDISSTCHNYEISGKCSWGVSCRFGSGHLTEDGKNIVNEEKLKNYQPKQTKNILSKDLQNSLWKKKYNFELSEKVVQYNDSIKKNKVSTLRDEIGVLFD